VALPACPTPLLGDLSAYLYKKGEDVLWLFGAEYRSALRTWVWMGVSLYDCSI